MSGLIERIIEMGSERPELVKAYQGAPVGGQRVTIAPKDLASIITLLRPRRPNSCLAIEGESMAAARFLAGELGVSLAVVNDETERDLRKTLRGLPKPFDLVTIDPRGLPLSADEIWRYLEGGKEERKAEFGAGAPKDYGIHKLAPGACVVVNRSGEAGAALWFRLRARYGKLFQGQFVGVVHVA